MVFLSQVSTRMLASDVCTRNSGFAVMVNVFDHCSARVNGTAARHNPKITDAILCIPCLQPGQIHSCLGLRRCYATFVSKIVSNRLPLPEHPSLLGGKCKAGTRYLTCDGSWSWSPAAQGRQNVAHGASRGISNERRFEARRGERGIDQPRAHDPGKAYAMRNSVLSENGTYTSAAVAANAAPNPIFCARSNGATAHN